MNPRKSPKHISTHLVSLNFSGRSRSRCRILCLGAHADDIEIGCGGTILRWIAEQANLQFCWVVFSSGDERKKEALKSAHLFLRGSSNNEILVENFRDGFFPYIAREIKEYFEGLKRFSPDIVLTHYRDDRHQDHRLLSDLTWNTFRHELILEYEIPKYDGDLGQPNCFVHLTKPECEKKVRYILDIFKTQKNKQWLTEDTLRAIMRLRGVESNAPERYAEAFYCRKMIV